LLHLYFLVLEMFLWTKPYGRRVFGLTEEKAQATKVLAANRGPAATASWPPGSCWGLSLGADGYAIPSCCFSVCVILAGIFGAATVGRKILYVQALPAAVAVALGCVG